ncbi:MAG: Re/Si-specific NAD(P)(+) transhydrogenase subunit alpha, partial [Myxococcales bacterium]|nr:Re/Si-specific NAD(P)(+) transhydrogenase subunit alpha [Myxococcales bacterium]
MGAGPSRRPDVRIGVPRETLPGETRVAVAPDTVKTLLKQGFSVVIEAGAGALASFPDERYEAAGATIGTRDDVWGSPIVVKLHAPRPLGEGDGAHEADLLHAGTTLISFLYPAQNGALVERLASRGVTVLAMDQVPRISRAQKLDALSSMANIAGYRAVLEAASHFGSFFTGQVTAAGRTHPAKVLIIGAGVAGLAAIGAARGLGAIVRAFDTRSAAREQVQSLGAEFLEVTLQESGDGHGGYAKEMSPEFIAAEMALFRAQAKDVDVVITTALIPGRPAPKLWLADMVPLMKPGSVIVDLAARQGGNCELTVPGEVVVRHGVTIIGHHDLATRLPGTASQLYGNNVAHLLDDMGKAAGFHVDETDVVVRGALVLNGGELRYPPPPLPAPEPAKPAPVAAKVAPPAVKTSAEHQREVAARKETPRRSFIYEAIALILLAIWIYMKVTLGGGISPATRDFLNHATVFVLACFVGWQVVWNVAPALHTPLMSV